MKRVLGRLCLVVLSVAAWVAAAEGLVRVFAPHVRDAAIPGHLFEIDTELGWKFAPSRAATHHSRYFSASYTINSDGFRDKPRTRVAAADVRRVLLYGDSLVFGWGLNDGERFSDRLEDAVPGLEMVNHAVPGYGLDQEVILYGHEGGSLDADEVIFFVATSTLSRLDTGFIYSKYKPRYVLGEGGSLRLVPVPRRRAAFVSLMYETLSPLYLPYLLETEIGRVRESTNARAAGDENARHEPRPLIDDLAKSILRAAWTTAQHRGHRMTVLIADLPADDRRELRAFGRDTGMAWVDIPMDIGAGTSAIDDSPFVFGTADRHWNARGNELIAEQLRRQMMR